MSFPGNTKQGCAVARKRCQDAAETLRILVRSKEARGLVVKVQDTIVVLGLIFGTLAMGKLIDMWVKGELWALLTKLP